jgi:hypothetical protein
VDGWEGGRQVDGCSCNQSVAAGEALARLLACLAPVCPIVVVPVLLVLCVLFANGPSALCESEALEEIVTGSFARGFAVAVILVLLPYSVACPLLCVSASRWCPPTPSSIHPSARAQHLLYRVRGHYEGVQISGCEKEEGRGGLFPSHQ